jgi:hypothetical protein
LREAIEAATVASRDPGTSLGLMSEPNESTGHLQQAYPSSSMPCTELLRNIGVQIDTGRLDSLSSPGANSSSRIDFNSSFALSPRVQAVSSPQLILNRTGNHSMISGEDFLPEQTSHNNFYDNVDSFFDFYIRNDAPEPSVPSLGENHIENSETLVEPDQDLFGVDEHNLDGSLIPLLEAENELESATAPWRAKHDGHKF